MLYIGLYGVDTKLATPYENGVGIATTPTRRLVCGIGGQWYQGNTTKALASPPPPSLTNSTATTAL
jgi:hypothetical protein